MSKRNKRQPAAAKGDGDVVVVRDDPIPIAETTAALPISTRDLSLSWPNEKPMPTSYPKPAVVPCQNCRRMRRDDGRPAVICSSQAHGIAYMRCRVCERRFKLPIR
jgi:hypothetical protein